MPSFGRIFGVGEITIVEDGDYFAGTMAAAF